MNVGMTLVLVDYLLDFAEEKGTRGRNRKGCLSQRPVLGEIATSRN